MGIRGLERMVETSIKDARDLVDLAHEVETFKRENDISGPVKLIVDLPSYIRFIIPPFDYARIGGLSSYTITEKILKMVDCFRKIGVTLVFISSNGYPANDYEEKLWFKRQTRNFNATQETIRLLKVDGPWKLSSIYSDSILDTSVWRTVIRTIIAFGLEFCRFKKYGYQSITTMVAEKDVIGILAQDSNLIIYNPSRLYYSLLHLKLENMTTMVYRTDEIAKYFNLDTNQLPLFAAVRGVDSYSMDELENFHARLKECYFDKKRSPNLLKQISNFVLEWPGGEEVFQHLEEISSLVYGDKAHVEKLEWDIRKYMPLINNNDNFSDELNVDPQLEIRDELFNRLSSVETKSVLAKNRAFLTVHCFAYSDFESSTNVLKLLRQRFYGILQYEKSKIQDEEKIIVEENFISNEDGSHLVQNVTPILPNEEEAHPGLSKLWQNQVPLETKLNLFLWSIRGIFSDDNKEINTDLKNIPCKYIVPTFAMHYLSRVVRGNLAKCVQMDEIDFLIAFTVMMGDPNRLPREKMVKKIPTLREVYLANIYQTSCEHVNLLWEVCGRPYCTDIKDIAICFYDGNIFHSMVQAFNERGMTGRAFCSKHPERLELFDKIMRLVHS